MKKNFIFILLISFCLGQSLNEYYIPAGFQNPLLKSGQFISGMYYYHYQVASLREGSETTDYSKNINMTGYLGITDRITLRTKFIVSPEQNVQEVTKGGKGTSTSVFNINPQLTVSYRPVNKMEIFSSIDIWNTKNTFGDRTVSEDVPIGIDPETGEMIYERRTIVQPALPDIKRKGFIFMIGINYCGQLW